VLYSLLLEALSDTSISCRLEKAAKAARCCRLPVVFSKFMGSTDQPFQPFQHLTYILALLNLPGKWENANIGTFDLAQYIPQWAMQAKILPPRTSS